MKTTNPTPNSPAWRAVLLSSVTGSFGDRPFPAKYPGVCALTGVAFYAGDTIRAHELSGGTVYTADRGWRAINLRCDPTGSIDALLERSCPFDAALALEWIDAGEIVVLVKKNGTDKVVGGPRYSRPSEKQFAARTSSMIWMIRRDR